MNKLFHAICLLIIFITNIPAKDIQKTDAGYLTEGINDIKYKDMRIALDLWMKDLFEQNSVDVDLIFYESSKEIVDDYINTKIFFLATNPIFYLENFKALEDVTEEFWAIHRSNKQHERYVILVRNDSQIKTLKDLKNKTIATRSDNYLGKMFLDTELLREIHIESHGYIQSYIETQEFSTAILNTYFSKADACLVPEHTLDIVTEMNPSVKKDLRILKQSDEIFFALMGLFHKEAEPSLIKSFTDNVNTLKESSRGKDIFNLFKMQGLSKIPKENLHPLKEYYKEYLKLKQLYVKK